MAVKSSGLTSWQVASFRCGVAALTLWLLLPAARRRWSWRTLVVGACYAAMLVLYVLANKATTAASAVFLQSTAPLYVLLLAPLLLAERIRRRDVALMAVIAGGLALLIGGGETASATAPAPAAGNVLGALAGLAWGLTVLGLRWLGRGGEGAAAAVLAGNVLAFAGCLPAALPVAAGRPVDWLWVLYLGVFQVAVAYVLLTAAMRRVEAFEASLLLLVEPTFSPLWAWWAHGEVPRSTSLAGGALVLTASVLKAAFESRRRGAAKGGEGDAGDR